MSKLVKGYIAIFRGAIINEGIRGDMTDVDIDSLGELTIWESENLHPGEKYVRFIPKQGDVGLQTSCGKITVEENIFRICTQKGENEYTFELLEHIQTVDFRMKLPERYLHICDGCGKREILTSKEAFDEGWDYPGPGGIYKTMPNYGFGALVPRTCGNCGIDKSLYWKLIMNKDEIKDSESILSENLKEILERIQDEPMSLLAEE